MVDRGPRPAQKRRGQDPALRIAGNSTVLFCTFRRAVGAACMPPAGVSGGGTFLQTGGPFPVTVGRGRTPPLVRPGRCCATGKQDPSGRYAASSPMRGAFLRGRQPKAKCLKGEPLTGSRVKASPPRGGCLPQADGGVGTFPQSGTLRAVKTRRGTPPPYELSKTIRFLWPFAAKAHFCRFLYKESGAKKFQPVPSFRAGRRPAIHLIFYLLSLIFYL